MAVRNYRTAKLKENLQFLLKKTARKFAVSEIKRIFVLQQRGVAYSKTHNMYYYEANGQKHELGKNNSEAFTVLKAYYEAVAHLSVSMERTKKAYEISYFQTGLVKALKKMTAAKDELDVMAQAFYEVNIKERFAPSVLEITGSNSEVPNNWQEAYLALGKVLFIKEIGE